MSGLGQADIEKAEALWGEMGGANVHPGEVSWDDKWAMTFLVIFDLTGKEKYRSKAEDFMDYLLGLPSTPKGLVWINSFRRVSLRYAGNFAMWAMQAGHLGIMPEQASIKPSTRYHALYLDTSEHYFIYFMTNV